MVRFGVTVSLALLFSVINASTQPPSIGIKGGYHYIFNTSTLPVIQGSTDCGTFSNGNSSGFYGALTGEYAIVGDVLEISGSVGYSLRPASLSVVSRDNFEVLDPATNSFVSLQRQHVFTSNLGYLVVEAGVRSRPFAGIPIFFRAVFDAGNAVVDATYSQTEQITSPNGVLFPDGTQRRTTGTGEYPGIGTSYGVSGGIGAVLEVSKNVEICPEVSFRYGLNNITSSAEWKQNLASAGIQIRYRMNDDTPPPPPPTPPTPPSPPPPPPPPPVVVEVPQPEPVPVMIASISTKPLEIQETTVTQTYPLLPYVFFEEGSGKLPTKYASDENSTTFSENALPKSTLPIYYRMLDVLGSRMSKSSAKLVVTGTTDGQELPSASERKALGTKRSQEVVNYISKKWNISTSRFEVRSVDKPALTSNEKYIEGNEENRRVELSSQDGALLGPVLHTRFLEWGTVQPDHAFSVSVVNPNQATGWDLQVAHNGKPLAEQRGQGVPPATVSFSLNQQLTDKLGPVISSSDNLTANITVARGSDTAVGAETSVPIIKTVNNFEVSRLSLIVFDYDKSVISEVNQEMMKRVVASAVRDGSTAIIKGSTDRLGEAQHNMELSSNRATSVESYVRLIVPNLKLQEVRGIGASELPYDNSLPEGRFYCRTVSLTITTPLR